MKRVLIYILCLVLFLQNSLVTYAEETSVIINEDLEQLILENELESQDGEVEENENKEDVEVKETEEDGAAKENEDDSELKETEIETDGEAKETETKIDSELKETETETDDEAKETETETDNEIKEDETEEDEKIEKQAEVKDEITEETPIIEEITEEDPQYGRENGYIDESFYCTQMFGTENEYVHNSKYDECLVEEVIDVSKYQGDIDWSSVKQSGIDYAIIRAGYRGYGDSGTLNTDSYFAQNMEQALAAGVQVGVYFFSQAISVEEAKEEAEYVTEMIDGYTLALPVVIDYEYASSSDGLTGRLYNASLSKSQATENCMQFCSVIEDNGYTAMVYANKDMLENGLNASDISEKYMIWLANYGTSTSYEGDYQFWQYTQNGIVDGISGKVDKSFWYKETMSIYNGVDYSSVYNFKFYTETYSDIKKAFGNNQKAALSHFINDGMKEGRYGNAEFNVYTYKNRYADLRLVYRNNWKSYYMHYINCGEKEGRNGSGTSPLVNPVKKYKGIDYSAVYDFNYYLESNTEVKEKYSDDDVGALEYFVNYGMKACQQANEEFNAMTYRNRFADLRKLFGNDWVKYYSHYMNHGKKEGRDASGTATYVSLITSYKGIDYSSVYDYTYYIEKYPDIKKAFGDDENAVIAHFVNYGMSEGRQGNEAFNVKTYRNRYEDLRKAFGKDWKKYYRHYINDGKKEGRNGSGTSELINPTTVYNGKDYSAVYNFNYYIEKYSDMKKLYSGDDVEALKHFVMYGMSEGRQGNESFNVKTYRNRYADLRKAFGKDWKKYYSHYINDGKKEGRNGIGTSELTNPTTVYNGKDYSAVYNFNYYIEKYSDMKKLYSDDDVEALKHFVMYGMSEGRQGNLDFNVYVYKSNNKDLINVYGNKLASYYMHYINYGQDEGREATSVGSIKSCKVVDVTSENATVQIELELYESISKYKNYYIIVVDAYNGTITEKVLELGDINDSTEVVNISIANEKIKELLQGRLAFGGQNTDGELIISSQSVSISNPEALATNTTAIFKGTSKKGLQGITYASYDGGSDIVDARNANTKHTLLNLDISTIVSRTKKSGYIAYSYKGNTYYFSDLAALKGNISSLNAGYKQYLNGNSGTTPVAVSLCLLLGYNSENSYLIDPAARTSGHSYYLMNVREEKARETLEALFLYLGETFGQENCYVSNWILGNEINSSKAWNYGGNLNFETYMDCYATAFRLLYNGVKSTKTGNTVCISLDNGWTSAPDTYAGKTTLDAFAKKIHAMNANIDWSIAYHAYSYPLTRADFWNDYSNTTDSLSTKYISMRNIKVLTDYAGTLERTYGKNAGTIRVLLTEQGYSHSAGAEVQAQAIARGFYIAQFNDRIDAFIIRAVVDDKDETQGKLYFGLMNRNTEKRIAFYVYEYMDSDIDKFSRVSASGTVSSENYSKFNKAKEIVCNTNWNSYVPGFNKVALANIK